jgi:hypothetical protein
MQAQFGDSGAADISARLVLAAMSLLALLCPDERIGVAACVPVLGLIGYWLAKRRNVLVADTAEAEPEAVPVIVEPIVDTERGRMQ